jgi:hypothetical protein
LVPKSQNGSDSPKNLITLCSTRSGGCHAKIHNVSTLGGIRADHGELIKKGLDARRAKKGALGGIPYGFDRLPDGSLVPNGMEQKVIRMMRHRRNKGWSYATIADWLNAEATPTKRSGQWSRRTVDRILSRP